MLRKIAHALYQPYKWLVFFPLAFTLTFFFGIFAVIGSITINQKVGSYIGGVLWARTISFITPMFVSVKGKENIDKRQSYIITPNHQSNFDIFALYGWIGIDIKWIMKKELKKIPGIGFGSEKVGHIFLDRSNQRAAVKSLEEAKQKLKGGTSVVIFPEGTRGNGTEFLAFKRGAFKLALELGLPILPVTINGTKNIMPGKSKSNVMPGKASIYIHKPISIEGYTQENMKELMDKVKAILESRLI
jgi:1-acyl-sn-glycerol-3-phosphate acyltransferase